MKLSTHIKAPKELVFEAFADIPNGAEMIESIIKIEMLTDGKVGAGTRWKETRRMFGKEHTEEMGFTVFETPNRYVVEADSGGSHFRTEFQFKEEDDGTGVTLELTSTPTTFMAKLMRPLCFFTNGIMSKMMNADLEDCKKYCESNNKS